MAVPKKELVRVHIRWLTRRDLPEVLQIEQESFDYAWTEEDFLLALGRRNSAGMVAEHEEKVIGYVLYRRHKLKRHILNLAVHPDYRYQGIGAQLVDKLKSMLSIYRWTRITLFIRERNVDAQLFFRRQGFFAARVLRAYYEDSGED